VAAVDDAEDVDEAVVWVRAHGPQPLPLDGWDRSSVWGWDEASGSLYAHLWRNSENAARPPAIRVEAGEYTPAIIWPEALAQHIAMATGCDPWTALTALFDAAGLNDEDGPPARSEGGTVVTMTEGYRLTEWPYK
jgi:hypothetical protein